MRGVKDLLADTCDGGRLAHIIARRAKGALGFYPAWTSGFLKLLFPEIGPAVEQFMARPDWGLIERAKDKGRQRAREALLRLREVMEEKDRRKVPALARSRVIEPLTGR